uniref:Uncharacterized protein n=1 Tax=Mycena chlorophos TaxID=658473 RepID=A0ABQ0L6T2_MYCCL|nr:predicted protein [Mycena chlorophos]
MRMESDDDFEEAYNFLDDGPVSEYAGTSPARTPPDSRPNSRPPSRGASGHPSRPPSQGPGRRAPESEMPWVTLERHLLLERKLDGIGEKLDDFIKGFASRESTSGSQPAPSPRGPAHSGDPPHHRTQDPSWPAPSRQRMLLESQAARAAQKLCGAVSASFRSFSQFARLRHLLHKLLPPDKRLVATVSAADRVAYETRRSADSTAEATSPEDFRIDISSPPTSPWNASATRVITQYFYYSYGIPPTAILDNRIRTAFNEHLRFLRRQFKDLQKGTDRIAAKKKRVRVTTRLR